MSQYRREGPRITDVVRPDLRRRAHYAVDQATRKGERDTKRTIRGVGLGRLAGAVGFYTSTTLGKTNTDRAFGAIFARGPAEGRGNQALLAYSDGAVIYPRAGKQWLAFATDKIPKRVGPYKMTPARYRASGLVQSIGRLQFVRGKKSTEAFLIARDVNVSRRTGRAAKYAGRVPRGSDRTKSVIAFVLIRYTARARRFSQDAIMLQAQAAVVTFAGSYRAR